MVSDFLIGYARADASTLVVEHRKLRDLGCMRIFSDEVGGAAVIRPGLGAALAAVRSGQTLVVVSLERLSWRFESLIALVDDLHDRRVNLRSIDEGFDARTSDAFGTFQALARFGLEVANSRSKGRADPRQKVSKAAVDHARMRVGRGEATMKQAASELGVSRSTLYRRANRS